jgi:MerR family copper efflux transcriptional regulator
LSDNAAAAEGTLLQIGEAADRTGLSVRTLRHWDQVGLVVPHGRTDGGYRLYTDADVQRLRVVRYMKPLNLSIEEMRSLLDDRDVLHADPPASEEEREQARARLDPLLELADRRTRKLTDQLTEVCSFSARLRVELETGLPSLGNPVVLRLP